ncbi:MAG: hypothetical protein LBH57_10060 [Treponema sp.]|jgi:hypothetical protein|nr:hypothetical protein [Treponema sp.]
MTEQERINYLIAYFLRLNDEGKVYINSITRQLARICGPEEDAPKENAEVPGVTGLQDGLRQEHPA